MQIFQVFIENKLCKKILIDAYFSTNSAIIYDNYFICKELFIFLNNELPHIL